MVNETRVKHLTVITTSGKRTKGESVKQDKKYDEKTFKIKQNITKQNTKP